MEAQPSTPRFAALELRNWKNFAECSIKLASRVFLVGPNASGKSNFLDAFRFLRDLVAPGGGLREAIDRWGGVGSLRCLAARRLTDVSVNVTVAATDGDWRYRIDFTQDKQRRILVKKEQVQKGSDILLDRPNREDAEDPARLSQTYLEQINVNKEFRALADFFGSVRYLHLVPQLVREPDRSVGKAGDPFGGDFLQQLA